MVSLGGGFLFVFCIFSKNSDYHFYEYPRNIAPFKSRNFLSAIRLRESFVEKKLTICGRL